MFTLFLTLLLAAATAFAFLYRKGFFLKRIAGTNLVLPVLPVIKTQRPVTTADLRPQETPATDALESVDLELEDLQFQLDKKKAERQALRDKEDVLHHAAVELDLLDTSIQSLEYKLVEAKRQLEALRPSAAALDELHQAHRMVEADLAKAQDRLQWAKIENEALEEALEEKDRACAQLTAENAQLQQKVQLLLSLNSELEGIADARRR
jgi:hypothetical protein